MKSYDEMAETVLHRVHAYEKAKMNRMNMIRNVGAALCCVVLTCLIGFGATLPSQVSPNGSDPINHTGLPGVQVLVPDNGTTAAQNVDATEKQGTEATEAVILLDQVYVNVLAEEPVADTFAIARMRDDFLPMGDEELYSYYGIYIHPTVPADLARKNSNASGIYRRFGGTGEVYWDQNSYDYANEDDTRFVAVAVNSDTLPYSFYAILDENAETSDISGLQVLVGQWEGCYYAEFIIQNVGFRVVSRGLTLEELVNVIASLAQK